MTLSYNHVIVGYDNLEIIEKLKKRLLFWAFFYLTFHHSFFAIYVFKTNTIQSLSEGLSAIFVIVGALSLKLKANIIIPTVVLASYSFLSISVGVWENGGIYSSEIAWYIITIFSIVVALDRNVGIGLYIITFLTMVLMGGIQYFNLYDFTKNLVINGESYALLSCSSVFIIIGLIIKFIFTTENIDIVWKKEKEDKIKALEIERAKQLKQDKINSENFTKQLLENTESERKRIATDLHDSISHELLTLKSFFHDDVNSANAKIDSIIDNVRSISRNLHPVMFDKIGLVHNIEQLVTRLQTQYNFLISTDITYNGSLSSANELQIYRIVQESLTNIIKYANAHAAKITITEDNNKVKIEIKDNGKGFDVTKTLNSNKAFGLHNIIERSRAVGGVAVIKSSSAGTIINIEIYNTQS
jgi:signal transduction histidine kinase